jgi:hypothetical protein
MTQAYPLDWPAGWPRTKSRKTNSPFKMSAERVRRLFNDETRRLGAQQVVVSSNVPIRNDGMMYADAARRRIDDPGVAVYFMLDGKAMTMAQDAYQRPEDNLRSLTLAIEAMRAIERHGGGTMMERAFSGFTALPPPEKPKRPWWKVLGYSEDPADREGLTDSEIDMRYRTLAKKRHPDIPGGSHDAMNELSEAKAEAIADTTR